MLCFSRELFSREKAGLRRDAVRSQVIKVLEAQEIKETVRPFQRGETCVSETHREGVLPPLPLRWLPGGGGNHFPSGSCTR
jgi:hypothetical protein